MATFFSKAFRRWLERERVCFFLGVGAIVAILIQLFGFFQFSCWPVVFGQNKLVHHGTFLDYLQFPVQASGIF